MTDAQVVWESVEVSVTDVERCEDSLAYHLEMAPLIWLASMAAWKTVSMDAMSM